MRLYRSITALLALTIAPVGFLAAESNQTISAVHYHTPYMQHEVNLQAAHYTETPATAPPLFQHLPAQLHSEIAYVQDINSATTLYEKNSDQVRPIASITKLMTALVVIEAGQDMDEQLEITRDDIDRLKNTTSRLQVGSTLSRADMLHIALMSSENRAANALGRYYPGGLNAFVRAMNDKARALGMRQTHFEEPTGLSHHNVASPHDLVLLMQAANQQALIKQYSTSKKHSVEPAPGRQLVFANTNRLVKNDNWEIQMSKTGFINEAGRCLVFITQFEGRDVAIVLLNAQASASRFGDAARLRQAVEGSNKLALLSQ